MAAVVAPAGGAPPGATRWGAVWIVTGAGILSACQLGKAPMALAAIQADLDLDLATASWLLSAFALVGALGGIAIGVAVDHAGARRMVLGGLMLQALAGTIGAMAGAAPLLLAARAVEGAGFLAVAVAAPALIVAATRHVDRGPAIALWATFVPAGMTLVMLGAPILESWGWRGFWLLNAAVLFFCAALCACGTRGIDPGARLGEGMSIAVRLTLAASGPWRLAGLFAAFGAIFFALFGFLPPLLSERLAIGIEAATLLAAAAVAANALGNLACAPLLARGVPPVRILLGAFAAMTVCGFGILPEWLPGGAVLALCFLFSAAAGLLPVVLIDAAPRHAARPDLVGATIGFMMQGNNVGIVLGPAIGGALAGAFGWGAIALLILAIAIPTGVLSLRLRAVDPAAGAAATPAGGPANGRGRSYPGPWP